MGARGKNMAIERVGFVGLGIMGAPMTANLLKAGFAVTVWNRTPSRAEPLAELGAFVASSPAEVASRSQVTISCVSDTPDVLAVALGEQGIIHGAEPGSAYIDCSTISPDVTRDIATAMAAAGVDMLDAPVSGGDVGAKAGTLAIMVGGDSAAFDRCLPVLQAMGRTIVHVGPAGAGQVVKLCNQAAGAVTLVAAAEAVTIARRAGVDPVKMLEVVTAGAAGSWMLSNLAPRAIKGDFEPGFMVDLMQKDLRLVMETAVKTTTPLPGVAVAQQLFRVLEARGRGRQGMQAMVDALAVLAGDSAVQPG